VGKSKGDHVLAVIKAGISAAPVFGGPIASLIGDYIPTSTQKRAEEATRLLAERLEELGDRLDANAVDKEEFAELFKSCYLIAVRSRKTERLRIAANLMANMLLRPDDAEKMQYEELDHFAKCAETLSIGALRVLGIAYRLAAEERNKSVRLAHLVLQTNGWEEALVEGLAAELAGWNLLDNSRQGTVRRDGFADYPIWLTPLGTRFVEHLLSPGGS
jgi:hypothetical protein